MVGIDHDDDRIRLVARRSAVVRELAEGRYVLVCRAGGAPSWLDRLVAFVRRDPIEAVTVVADEPAAEGEEIVVSAGETDVPGVYDAVSRR